MALTITWLGHSAFIIELPDGKRVLADPWISNPSCPKELSRPAALGSIDAILISHGHSDHVGEVVSIARETGAPVVCVFELGEYLADKGLRTVAGMGIGGTQAVAGISITMTQAVHSGSVTDGGKIIYLGGAVGFVLRAPGTPTIYFAGDTGIFGDMKIIGEIYKPQIGFLPIGDHYTMGPDTAALAARWLGLERVVPMHWGTFPLLHGTPAQLKAQLANSGIEVVDIAPGQHVRI